jgi:hypothetical protein
MKPRPHAEEQDDLLRPHLAEMIDLRYELAKLAAPSDWEFFETEWGGGLSLPDRAASHIAAAGGGPAVSSARLSVV